MSFTLDSFIQFSTFTVFFAALTQMVACLSLVQQVRGLIPGRVVNFHFKFSTLVLGGVEM